MSTFLMLLRTALIAVFLMAGLMAASPVSAQDSTPVGEEVTTEVEEIATDAEDAVEDEEDGFDWGLLGLLGLAGLAGLMRRPQPVVHDIDRTVTTGTRVDSTRGPNDAPRV